MFPDPRAKEISTLRALVLVLLFLVGLDTIALIFVADFVAKIEGILHQLGG